MSFQYYIKNIKKEYNMTQPELAQRLNVSLDTIKKIESGITSLPSSKMLKALSEFTNKNEARVIQEINFPIYDKNNSKNPDFFNFIYNYLCYCYINGYNIGETLIMENIEGYGNYLLAGEIIKRKDPKYNILVDHAINMMNDITDLDDEIYYYGVIAREAIVLHSLEKEYREYQVLFDANNPEQVKWFNLFKQKEMAIAIRPLYFILYDSMKGEIVKKIREL